MLLLLLKPLVPIVHQLLQAGDIGAAKSRELEDVDLVEVDGGTAAGVEELGLLENTLVHIVGGRQHDLQAQTAYHIQLLLLLVLSVFSLSAVDVAEVVILWSRVVLVLHQQCLHVRAAQLMRLELRHEISSTLSNTDQFVDVDLLPVGERGEHLFHGEDNVAPHLPVDRVVHHAHEPRG